MEAGWEQAVDVVFFGCSSYRSEQSEKKVEEFGSFLHLHISVGFTDTDVSIEMLGHAHVLLLLL